jgi:alpha,alpha-trehalose phosphorylase
LARRRRACRHPLRRVVKQPDLVLAMQLFTDVFTPEQRARNFEYYERITVRDSSLSACTEAVAAADAGHLRLAFDYAAEAALVDLHDVQRNTCDGLHLASLAGTWIALVMGFGGMRDLGESLTFMPRLPDALTRLAFTIRHRGRCLHVAVTTQTAEYLLTRGDGTIRITHHEEPLTGAGRAADSADARPTTAGAAAGPRAATPVTGMRS